MVDIYVLECEDGNVYVGKTTRGKKRLQEHIKGKGSEWTKLHKPKKVMAYYTNATDCEVEASDHCIISAKFSAHES
tara:strand:- start:5471 stop:5698 length:228 start_codon:yes stop_codon:yes gene_type:complete